MPAKPTSPDRRKVLAASAALAASGLIPGHAHAVTSDAIRGHIGRIPSGDPVAARLRVLGQADHDRLESPAYRARLGRAYHKLVYYNRLDKGGHFAAWEQPQLFAQEVRAGFRPLRT